MAISRHRSVSECKKFGEALSGVSRRRWLTRLPALALVLTIGTSVLPIASEATIPEPMPQPAAISDEKNSATEPGQVDVKKSRVYIFVDKTGLGHQHGVEGRLSRGSVQPGATDGAGEFVFDMQSFDADTDAARRYLGLSGSTDASTRQQVNQNMRNTSILNINQYPTATFSIKSATESGRKSRSGQSIYEFVGEFTLRGKTRPLQFEAEVESKDGMVHVKGQFAILQTQYGITPYKRALGAVGVADRLVIHGDIWVAAEQSETK